MVVAEKSAGKFPAEGPVDAAKPTSEMAIVIANACQLGDALSTFPLAAVLKRRLPAARIYLCSSLYVSPLVQACEYFDGCLSRDEVCAGPEVLRRLNVKVLLNLQSDEAMARAAHAADVEVRVTNLRRPRGAQYSNRFALFSRSNSRRHTVALNLSMLKVLGIEPPARSADWPALFGLTRIAALDQQFSNLLCDRRFNLVLHPKSGGHGREWPLERFMELVQQLPAARFKLFITGTAAERREIEAQAPALLSMAGVVDLMGRQTFPQFLSFLSRIDGIVASGTGPLHIAAAMGRHALGIFPPRRSMNETRWCPIGIRAESLSHKGQCTTLSWRCKKAADGPACACTASITGGQVSDRVMRWKKTQESTAALLLPTTLRAHLPSEVIAV